MSLSSPSFTQGHVDRDVGGRAANEEGGQAAFTQGQRNTSG